MIGAIICYIIAAAMFAAAFLISFKIILVNRHPLLINRLSKCKIGEMALFEKLDGKIFAGKVIAREHDLICTDDLRVILFPPTDAPPLAFSLFFAMMEGKGNGTETVPPGTVAILAAVGNSIGLYFIPTELRVGKIVTKYKGVGKM